MNSKGSQKKSFKSVIYKKISISFPNDFYSVKLYQDKVTNHSSENTTTFLEKMKIDTNVKYVLFQHIPANSIHASLMDYCVFKAL